MEIPVGTGIRHLGISSAGDVERIGGKLSSPLRLALDDFLHPDRPGRRSGIRKFGNRNLTSRPAGHRCRQRWRHGAEGPDSNPGRSRTPAQQKSAARYPLPRNILVQVGVEHRFTQPLDSTTSRGVTAAVEPQSAESPEVIGRVPQVRQRRTWAKTTGEAHQSLYLVGQQLPESNPILKGIPRTSPAERCPASRIGLPCETVERVRLKTHQDASVLGSLRVQLLTHQLIQQRRVRLSFRQAHHLAHEKRRHRLLTPAILLHLLGIRSNHFLNHLLQRRRIADLLRLFPLINRTKIFALLKRRVEQPFELLAGKLSGLGEIRRLHQSLSG